MTQAPEPQRPDAPSTPVRAEPTQLMGMFPRARPMSATDAARESVSGTVVKVTGRAVPGPGGPLRAPLSGAECVWYRSIVFRELRQAGLYRQVPMQPVNPIAQSDIRDFGVHMHANLRGQQLGTDNSSIVPFGIGDGQFALTVDPRIADIDTDVFGINAVVHGKQHGVGLGNVGLASGTFGADEVHTEWIIPVGAELFALGTVAQTGAAGAQLVAQGDDAVLVTTKSEQHIESRTSMATQAGQLGMPFGGAAKSSAFVIGFAVLAVIVVIVIVFLTVVP